ncbi:MAG: GGDEF domain-containing protein [Eubacterium sp.]|nr:GGDEF domain-containing protein [Eubacterium sp.]
MRALENYNRQRDKKLGHMVGTCMKSLWACYAVINVCWLILRLATGGYQKGILQKCFFPMLVTFVLFQIYHWLVVKKERELHHIVNYLILNLYLILLLAHPSGLSVLDGLLIGVIAMFPIWTDQRWAKIQVILFAVMVVVRHVVIYVAGYRTVDFWHLTNLIGMFCIGGLVYYNVKYVHDQTMLLGDATRMDAATGLYNHEYFYEELEKRMEAFAQTPEKSREDASFCLLIADIDNFKRVNDTYGHAFGDEVLLGLAGIFKNYCGAKDFAARYGGEEFVLIVGGCHKKDALTRANTIRRRFADTVFADASGEEHQFTVSLGVAEYDRPWNTASKFFDQADQALYQAKNTGKNRVCSS